jgi:hypothetical protein
MFPFASVCHCSPHLLVSLPARHEWRSLQLPPKQCTSVAVDSSFYVYVRNTNSVYSYGHYTSVCNSCINHSCRTGSYSLTGCSCLVLQETCVHIHLTLLSITVLRSASGQNQLARPDMYVTLHTSHSTTPPLPNKQILCDTLILAARKLNI